jgi:hypothetical protein
MDPSARSAWRQALRWLAVTPFERAAHTINYSRPAWLADVVWPFLAEASAQG